MYSRSLWRSLSSILFSEGRAVHRVHFIYLLGLLYPGPKGFLLILSFFSFRNLQQEALIEAPSRKKRKPLVKIVENLTFMLAQHLTAVKDVIFFWPITSPKIFNPSNHMTRRAIKNISIRNDGQKLMAWKWGSQRSWPEAFFSRLSALRANKKNERRGSRRKICQERIKESLWDRLWDQGTLLRIFYWI